MEHSIRYLDFNSEKAKQVISVYEENEEQLTKYLNELLWWNAKINLVSRNVSRETIRNHILHSLALMQSNLFVQSGEIIDSGTGGGLPGIPLAIANPDKKIILNDIVAKKMMACKAMVSSLSLKNTEVEAGSVEQVQVKSATIISKHAFKIDKLYQLIHRKNWSHLLLLKGKEEVSNELEGINESLQISIIDLYPGFENVFFEGKAMVEISRL